MWINWSSIGTYIFMAALAILAGRVAYGQVMHENVWIFICTYWIVLTIKNSVDLIRRIHRRFLYSNAWKRGEKK